MAELTSSSNINAAYKVRGNRNPQRVKPYQALTFLCLVDFFLVVASGGIGISVVAHAYPQISLSQYAPVWLAISVTSLLFFIGLGCYKSLPSDCRNKIPLLCWLFRHDSLTSQSRELLIFITPRIIRGMP